MDTGIMEELINQDKLNIKSKLITIKDIVEDSSSYSIPLYQRLYVWEPDQINTLLEDLERALKTPDEYYFLGGTMIIENQKRATLDLIDGQQRFTTLWLISNEIKEELENFAFIKQDNRTVPRLYFSIREFANRYFQDPSSIVKMNAIDREQLEVITQAQKTIKTFLNDEKERGDITVFKQRLAKFIYNRVAFIETEMPDGIDENRLFEILNNRGVQLQQHEILKSKLIHKIPDNEKEKYAQIWEACSIMDEYVEKNIKEVCGFKWREITENREDDTEIRGITFDIKDKIGNKEAEVHKEHLLDILSIDNYEIKRDESKDLEYDSGNVRSIISFPMFLQHTLRIFLFINNSNNAIETVPEVNEKKLIEVFEDYFLSTYNSPKNATDFIDLLFKLRINFDKFIIKWVTQESKQEFHLIKRLYKNKDVLQRREPTSNEGFALLQSMLYHSQQITTLYWLTPFMYKTLEPNISVKELYTYLRKLDNQMFCSTTSEELSERSWNLLGKKIDNFQPDIRALSTPSGTHFWSYWFYKMDFILWYLKSDERPEWKEYRMTKKNSVEHISPQNRRDYDESDKLWGDDESLSDAEKRVRLDDFGNLVLLAVGMNSEYSNKSFKEKKASFNAKKRLESLKSDLIFKEEHWSWEKCVNHREEMIQLFKDYFTDSMK